MSHASRRQWRLFCWALSVALVVSRVASQTPALTTICTNPGEERQLGIGKMPSLPTPEARGLLPLPCCSARTQSAESRHLFLLLGVPSN
jgi:hypothetical protein